MAAANLPVYDAAGALVGLLQTYRNNIGGSDVDSEAVTPTDPLGVPFGLANPQWVGVTNFPTTFGAAQDGVWSVGISGAVTVNIGLTDAQLRAAPVPVSGPLTDTQLRAAPVVTSAALRIAPSNWDYVGVTSYTTDNQPLVAVYRTGGSSGAVVATATMTYSGGAAGGNLTSVTWT